MHLLFVIPDNLGKKKGIFLKEKIGLFILGSPYKYEKLTILKKQTNNSLYVFWVQTFNGFAIFNQLF